MKPSLFGLKNTNRDFSQRDSWGKNQFNSSFPTALACFMYSEGIEPIYLKLGADLKIQHTYISVKDLFGMSPISNELFFAFESDYVPYRSLVIGNLPRIDLITQDIGQQTCLAGLEIKLTALPDNVTCYLSENKFGAEIVIRPDSIVYLALSIATLYKENIDGLKNYFSKDFDNIQDWTNGSEVILYVGKMIQIIDNILQANIAYQIPLIMQPIWKTLGKSPQLAENCLDIFVWSNFGFTRLFLNLAKVELNTEYKITRQQRSVIWLFKMLYDFSQNQKINHAYILDQLSYNTKNDKAFAISGKISQSLMACEALVRPRIAQKNIKQIILNGGHLMLSPERRFDAILYNTPHLFDGL